MPQLPLALVRILDARNYDEFAREYGPRVRDDGESWFRELLTQNATLDNFRRLYALAWFVFVERSGRSFGEPRRFELTPNIEALQELIYLFQPFSALNVPFDDWSPSFAKAQSLAAEMLNDHVDIRNDVRIEGIRELATVAIREMSRDPKSMDEFCEYLNGAY